jgi:poly-beta-1,6-N-acetyl-D-glucosamine synthase
MRSLLALIALCGVSLVFWGCVGVCRFIHERARDIGRRATSVTFAMGAAPLSSALVLALCLTPLMGLAALTLLVFSGDDSAPVVMLGLVLSWFGLCLLLAWWRARPGAPADHAHSGSAPRRIRVDEVAVLVAAHNEGKTIHICLDAATRIIAAGNIFVASDGSTDDTVRVARERGCNVLDIQPNGGKARALTSVVDHFAICERYAAVLILDADAQVDEHYLERALPLFDDPAVVAVAGHAVPKWYPHWRPRWPMLFNAYRIRLYRVLQALLRYGQTWKYSNVSFIVPGFASMYRCSALVSIDIAAPGLIIEDFNMTFELHHKRLGRIAYTPGVRCTSQEAYSLAEYVKQVRRWYLGFWQTIRRHGFWPSFFWLSLGVYVVEMLLQSLVFLSVPLILAWLLLGSSLGSGPVITVWLPHLGAVDLTLIDVTMGVFLADYVLTLLISALERKPILLVYGLGFPVLRWIDAFLFLYTLPLAFVEESDGRWKSPTRI